MASAWSGEAGSTSYDLTAPHDSSSTNSEHPYVTLRYVHDISAQNRGLKVYQFWVYGVVFPSKSFHSDGTSKTNKCLG